MHPGWEKCSRGKQAGDKVESTFSHMEGRCLVPAGPTGPWPGAAGSAVTLAVPQGSGDGPSAAARLGCVGSVGGSRAAHTGLGTRRAPGRPLAWSALK